MFFCCFFAGRWIHFAGRWIHLCERKSQIASFCSSLQALFGTTFFRHDSTGSQLPTKVALSLIVPQENALLAVPRPQKSPSRARARAASATAVVPAVAAARAHAAPATRSSSHRPSRCCLAPPSNKFAFVVSSSPRAALRARPPHRFSPVLLAPAAGRPDLTREWASGTDSGHCRRVTREPIAPRGKQKIRDAQTPSTIEARPPKTRKFLRQGTRAPKP